MSHTEKDKPFEVKKAKKPKRHPRMMRDKHANFCGIDCCGFKATMWSARAIEKREAAKEVAENVL